MKPPPLSPIQKRELLVGSYMDSYRRAGIPMSHGQVNDQVVADLEMVDAAERCGEISGNAPKNRKPERSKPRTDVIAKAEQETGVKRLGHAVPIWRPRFMFDRPTNVAERWGYAVGRIERILIEGTANGHGGPVYVGACGHLASAYHTVWACFQSRNLPAAARGFARNDFDGLTDRDAARAFMRAVEDICDRSTGVLGSWYVK